jgi:ankyrin repeat protein
VIATLLRFGADVNIRNRVGNTPLFRALINSMWSAALVLIDHPMCDLRSRDMYRNAPLHLAAAGCGSALVVQRLLQRGADTHTEGAVRYRKSIGFVFVLLISDGQDGRTAMHFAAARGDVDLIQLLLEHGAAVNVRDAITGATPLHWALRCGKASAAQRLLAAGADASICDTRGVSGVVMLRGVCGEADITRNDALYQMRGETFFAG